MNKLKDQQKKRRYTEMLCDRMMDGGKGKKEFYTEMLSNMIISCLCKHSSIYEIHAFDYISHLWAQEAVNHV